MQHIALLLLFVYFFMVKAKSQRAAQTLKQKARQRKQPQAK
jgi:hypothetical protein